MIKIRKATVKDFKKVKEIKTEFMHWEAKRDQGIDPKKIKKKVLKNTFLL